MLFGIKCYHNISLLKQDAAGRFYIYIFISYMCRNTKNSNTNKKNKNKDNNGILIDGEEYRRKQYPNECSIILDSSSISRDGIIKH